MVGGGGGYEGLYFSTRAPLFFTPPPLKAALVRLRRRINIGTHRGTRVWEQTHTDVFGLERGVLPADAE